MQHFITSGRPYQSTTFHVVAEAGLDRAIKPASLQHFVRNISHAKMPSDDTESLSTAITDNYLVPVTIDKEPIIFNGNDATIEGTLYECGRFYKRNDLFQPLFSHRAVALSNGKLAVESPNSV